ncbi:MAG: hypothetical protein ABIZ70_14475 [Gemmatimonadales bacterium]
MKPKTLGWLALIVTFFAFLAWTTLSAQKVECDVCVEFNGGNNCAKASHETEPEATRAAHSTACGPLAHGMNETIACDNRPAISTRCRTK